MGLSSIENLYDLKVNFRVAQKATGKSYARLLLEALQFRFGETGIGFSEFFGYKLYNSELLSPDQIHSFSSAAVAKQIWKKLNPPKFWGLAIDKVGFQIMMEGMGFAQPNLLALYSKNGRIVPGVKSLQNAEQIESFLKTTCDYPIFGKPSDSFDGRGAIGIKSYNHSRATVILQNNEERPISNLIREFSEWNEYLFQSSLTSHRSLVDFSGSSLSTMRMVVLFTKTGPELFRIVWKIPNKMNMADNSWQPRNVAAHIDPANGKVYAMIQSTETGYTELGHETPLGKRFLSSSPPFFTDATELVLRASRAFSMFRYQAWDIALTHDGPIALELNHNGDIKILQLGACFGILDEQFKSLLRQQNLRLKNPKRWFT